MRKTVWILCFFALTVKVEAQSINLGVRGGLAIPSIMSGSENPLSAGYSSRLAGNGGIFTEIGITDVFSLRFGVEYTGQGGKRDGVQAMSSNRLIMDVATRMGANITEETVAMLGQMAAYVPQIFYADVNNTVKFDYLMLPLSLQAGKTLGNGPFGIYVNAGPFVSFLMSGEQVSEGSSKLYAGADKAGTLWENIPAEIRSQITAGVPELAHTLENGTEFGTSDITGEIRPVNLGIHGNIGLSYRWGGRNRLFIEAGGNYGFIRIQKDKSNGVNRIGSANVAIGYSFNILSL
jgi:hypothetical protein